MPPYPLQRVAFQPNYLHEESVNVSPFFRKRSHFFSAHLLGDLAHQAHLVKGQLVLPGSALHDGGQEGLRVEEAGQPDGDGEAEV